MSAPQRRSSPARCCDAGSGKNGSWPERLLRRPCCRSRFQHVAGRGNFNLNGNVIAVPWPVFEPPTSGQGPLTIKVSADKLAQAPQLNPNIISALEQPRTRGDAFGYWGYPSWGWGYGSWGYRGGPYGPYAAGRVPPGYGYGPGMPGYPGAAGSQSQGQQHQAQPELTSNGLFVSANGAISTLESTATSSANTMRSAPVFASDYGVFGPGDNNGGNVGNIKEVMIDPRRGEVAFVLIERGGFLGLQPTWYAVPPEALAWSPYRGGYDLTVNQQLLNTAPPVHPANNNPPNGPLEFPASQLARLYQHFRINPYWEQGVAGSNPGNTAGLAGASSGSQQPANPK